MLFTLPLIITLPQGTQPNSTYLAETTGNSNKPSTSPASTVTIPRGTSTSHPAQPALHSSHPTTDSDAPASYPSTSNTIPVAHQAPLFYYPLPQVSQSPVSQTVHSEENILARSTPNVPVVMPTTPPRTWRPRSQSFNSNPAAPHKPVSGIVLLSTLNFVNLLAESATVPAIPFDSTPASGFGDRTSPKTPSRTTSNPPPAPVSPTTASRSWPKRHSEAPIDASALKLPGIPENISSYTPPSGNHWTTDLKPRGKSRCSSLPVERASPPASASTNPPPFTSTPTSTTSPFWGRDYQHTYPPPKPRYRLSDPTPTTPSSALSPSQKWTRSTIPSSKPSNSIPLKNLFIAKTHIQDSTSSSTFSSPPQPSNAHSDAPNSDTQSIITSQPLDSNSLAKPDKDSVTITHDKTPNEILKIDQKESIIDVQMLEAIENQATNESKGGEATRNEVTVEAEITKEATTRQAKVAPPGVHVGEEELELASRSLTSEEVSSLYADVVHIIKPYDLPFSPTASLETHGITVVKPDPTFATASPPLSSEASIPPGYTLAQTQSPFQPYSPRKSLEFSLGQAQLPSASPSHPLSSNGDSCSPLYTEAKIDEDSKDFITSNAEGSQTADINITVIQALS
jgi:hypothetical protein